MADRHVPGDRLSAFLDDELAESVALAVSRHLSSCERCLNELAQLRATRDALRGLPTLPAPALLPATAEATAIATGATRQLPRIRRRAGKVLAVAAAPLIAAVTIYAAGAENGEVEPETDLFLVEHVGLTGGGAVPRPVGTDP